MGKSIKTVEAFLVWANQVKGGAFVYRGMANASWKVESAAYRRIGQSHENPPPSVLQNYIKQLLESAHRRGFQERQGKSDRDLELLADLQHHGAATCLIDFTTNALIALWFACRDETPQKAGKVVAMATDDTARFASVGSDSIEEKIDFFLDKDKLWKWEPSHLSTRIVTQQSVFVFGTGTIDATHYESTQIARGSKGKIREVLQERFGITEQHLFSDFPGFALSHGHDRPYRDYTADDYFYLGVKSHQQGDYEKAREFYDQALTRDSQNVGVHNNRGLAKAAQKDYPGALADYDEALRLDPQSVKVYNNRGLAKAAQEDYPGALADYDEALRLDPQNAGAYHNRGSARAAQEDYPGALADYDAALRLDPQAAKAYNNRGSARAAQKDYPGALADYDAALRLDPQYAGAYNNRGLTKAAQKDYPGALADYDAALRLDPQNAGAYNNRGSARAAQKDYPGALADYDCAIEWNPAYARAYNNRCAANVSLDRITEAREDCETALALAQEAGNENIVATAERNLRLLDESEAR